MDPLNLYSLSYKMDSKLHGSDGEGEGSGVCESSGRDYYTRQDTQPC